MKSLALVLVALAAAPVAPASAQQDPALGNGITYTVPVSAGNSLTGQCTIVADRWTADYGPTHVYAQAVSPFGIWTRIHCSVTKNGTTYVDQDRTDSGAYVVVDAGDGTIPVAGIQVCAEVESQLSVDAHPHATVCRNF